MLQSLKDFIKKYWVLLMVLFLIMGIGLYFNRNYSSILELVLQNQESYKKQTQEIEKLQKESQVLKDELQKRYEAIITQIEQSYKNSMKELLASQRKDILNLVNQYKNDVPGLARQLANKYGIIYVE